MKEKIKRWFSWLWKKFLGKKEIKKLSNEEFKLLVGTLSFTYRQFCFNKIGHKKIDDKPWENFKDIWSHILISWRHYYLINLAKIFDKKSYNTRNGKKITLSIFRAIPKSKFSADDKETIKKIMRVRNEMLAHLEAEKVLQGKRNEEAYGLDFEGKQIESLIGNTFKLLNQIRLDYGFPYELNQRQQKNDAEKEFDKWYKVFKEAQ